MSRPIVESAHYVPVATFREAIAAVGWWMRSYHSATAGERAREAESVRRAMHDLAHMRCKRATERDKARALETLECARALLVEHAHDAPPAGSAPPAPEALPWGYDAEQIIAAAEAHAREYGADLDDDESGAAHAFGDLATVLLAAWRHLTPAQKRAVAAHDAVSSLRAWLDAS